MKRPTVTAYLNMKNNRHVVNVDGQKGITFPSVLISYLKKGIYSETMKACTPISKDGYTNYKFKVYNDEGELNNYFVVRVSHKERYLHKDTIQKIEEISGISNLITKVNVNRFIAGLTATALILVAIGPTMAKGLIKIAAKDMSSKPPSYSASNVTDKQKEQSLKEYYEDLKMRAQSGDIKAIDEYSIYLIQNELEQQKEEEKSNSFTR